MRRMRERLLSPFFDNGMRAWRVASGVQRAVTLAFTVGNLALGIVFFWALDTGRTRVAAASLLSSVVLLGVFLTWKLRDLRRGG